MPSYIYRCENGHEFEKTHTIKECDDTHCCPIGECDAKAERIQYETRPFILKDGGTGWHRDNYTRLGRSIKG